MKIKFIDVPSFVSQLDSVYEEKSLLSSKHTEILISKAGFSYHLSTVHSLFS